MVEQFYSCHTLWKFESKAPEIIFSFPPHVIVTKYALFKLNSTQTTMLVILTYFIYFSADWNGKGCCTYMFSTLTALHWHLPGLMMRPKLIFKKFLPEVVFSKTDLFQISTQLYIWSTVVQHCTNDNEPFFLLSAWTCISLVQEHGTSSGIRNYKTGVPHHKTYFLFWTCKS